MTRIIFGVCIVSSFLLAVAKDFVPAAILISIGIAAVIIRIKALRKFAKEKESEK